MKQQDYHSSLIAEVSPEEAFDSINNVRVWWAKNLEGSTRQVGDIFTVHFGSTFVAFEIMEMIPGKKIVWEVTSCYLHWINDKTEWIEPTIGFHIARVPYSSLCEGSSEDFPEGTFKGSSGSGCTRISMTHVGLVP